MRHLKFIFSSITTDLCLKLIGYAPYILNEQPAISSGFSWGAWIRTKILSSRGICPAVGRLPKTANILPLFSSFVGNSMATVYSINYRKGKSQLHGAYFIYTGSICERHGGYCLRYPARSTGPEQRLAGPRKRSPQRGWAVAASRSAASNLWGHRCR